MFLIECFKGCGCGTVAAIKFGLTAGRNFAEGTQNAVQNGFASPSSDHTAVLNALPHGYRLKTSLGALKPASHCVSNIAEKTGCV